MLKILLAEDIKAYVQECLKRSGKSQGQRRFADRFYLNRDFRSEDQDHDSCAPTGHTCIQLKVQLIVR